MIPAWIRRLLSRRLHVLFPVFAMLGVIGLSSVPGEISPDASIPMQVFLWVPPTVQNLLHIPVYAGLAFLWNWTLAGWLRPMQAVLLALVIVICFGMFDEWYQGFTPGRYSSWMDVLFNAVGAGLGVVVFWWARR